MNKLKPEQMCSVIFPILEGYFFTVEGGVVTWWRRPRGVRSEVTEGWMSTGHAFVGAVWESYLAVHKFEVYSLKSDLKQTSLTRFHVLHWELSSQLRTCTRPSATALHSFIINTHCQVRKRSSLECVLDDTCHQHPQTHMFLQIYLNWVTAKVSLGLHQKSLSHNSPAAALTRSSQKTHVTDRSMAGLISFRTTSGVNAERKVKDQPGLMLCCRAAALSILSLTQ